MSDIANQIRIMNHSAKMADRMRVKQINDAKTEMKDPAEISK